MAINTSTAASIVSSKLFNAPTYQELTLARDQKRKDLLQANGPTASIIFYWDPTSLQFINPFNVAVDPSVSATGSYVLQSNIYNFHSSSADMKNLFKDNANNVQITFTAQTQQNGEDYTWIVEAGLSVANEFLGGSDKQSVSTANSPNQLTNIPSPQDQVVIQNSLVSVWFGLAAQKQAGIWDQILSAIGLIANSPLFAVVPMAKLVTETVNAVSQMTNQIETQEKLTQILQGNRLDCRIAGNDASAPFALRSGFWLIANFNEIEQFIDHADKENLQKNLVLDIASQQYDVVDQGNNFTPIDVTYAVINFSLTAKTS
jgi:hypothetical protein